MCYPGHIHIVRSLNVCDATNQSEESERGWMDATPANHTIERAQGGFSAILTHRAWRSFFATQQSERKSLRYALDFLRAFTLVAISAVTVL